MAPPKSKSQTKAHRAGLQFPVGAVMRRMHDGRHGCPRVSMKAAVHVTATVEKTVALLLQSAGKTARAAALLADRRNPTGAKPRIVRILPHHVILAIDDMPDMRRLMRRAALIRPVGVAGCIARTGKGPRASSIAGGAAGVLEAIADENEDEEEQKSSSLSATLNA